MRLFEKLRTRFRQAKLVGALFIVVSTASALPAAAQSIDTQTMTDMINAFIPIIMSLFAILIPLMFFGKLMEFFERLLRSFGG